MKYLITLYHNNKISAHKSDISHDNNMISYSTKFKVVNLLDDYHIINSYIYNNGIFAFDKKHRNSCVTNILTLDINKVAYDYSVTLELLEALNIKYLLYKTTNDNYRLLLLLDKEIMSEEYKLLWERYCIKLNLIKHVDPTMKDVSRLWFATKEFISGRL